MITKDGFLHGETVAYIDGAGRKIMAQCMPNAYGREYAFVLRLFDFNKLTLLRVYKLTQRGAVSFYENHCNGTEKDIVLQFPQIGTGNADKSN